MPSNVTRFEWLYYASLALNLVQIVLTYNAQLAFAVRMGLGNPFIVLTHVLTFAVYILLVRWAAHGRKNWARWTLLFLFALTVVATSMQLAPMLSMSPIVGWLSIAYMLLQGMALFLVFTGNANEWFRKPEQPA